MLICSVETSPLKYKAAKPMSQNIPQTPTHANIWVNTCPKKTKNASALD